MSGILLFSLLRRCDEATPEEGLDVSGEAFKVEVQWVYGFDIEAAGTIIHARSLPLTQASIGHVPPSI